MGVNNNNYSFQIENLDGLITLSTRCETTLYNSVDNLLHNLHILSDDEVIKLADRIITLNERYGWKWYLLGLLGRLDKITITPDYYDWITINQQSILNNIKGKISDLSTS